MKFEQQKASNLLFILLSLGETSKSYCQETQKKSWKILEKMKMNLLIILHNSRLIKKQRKLKKKLEISSKLNFTKKLDKIEKLFRFDEKKIPEKGSQFLN